MAFSFAASAPPFARDDDGVIRIGGTRVTLETLLAAFSEGATAEEIVQQYPVLNLGDVYQAIGYCLHHAEEVGAYRRERETLAAEVRRENEVRFDPQGIRDRLMARRSGQER